MQWINCKLHLQKNCTKIIRAPHLQQLRFFDMDWQWQHAWNFVTVSAWRAIRLKIGGNFARLSECVQYLFAETLRESSGQLNFSHFRTSWRKRDARKLLGLCGFMVFLCLFVEFSGHKGITSKGISAAFFWARNETQNELNQENNWLVSYRSGKENNSAVLAFKKFSIPIPHLADGKKHQKTCLQSACDCF